jgi:hypothetical protein
MNHQKPRSLLVLGSICVALTLALNATALAATKGKAPAPAAQPAKNTGTGGSSIQKVPPHQNQGPLNLPPY